MNTIAAISTPDAPGGIAMIRISGDRAIALADEIFVPAGNMKPSQMRGYSCAYGQVSDGSELLDDVVLTVFRAPHSYTGEDTVEITCHGGIYLTKRILGLIYRIGADAAGPGEFTKRAFLNGKLSLSQAEAVMDVIQAEGAVQLRQAKFAIDGKLGREMREISDALVELLSALAYWQDDPEEMPPELNRSDLSSQLQSLSAKLRLLSKDYENGRVFRDGIRAVLLGKPNAGKSSIMNQLCGMRRSIVTNIPGTTRDVVTEQVKIGEFTLLLSDTAGLRETENEIEQIGISQAYEALDTSDLVLYVIDAAAGITDEDREMLEQCAGRKVIVLWNKTDLSDDAAPDLPAPVYACSATSPHAFDQLDDVLRAVFADKIPKNFVGIMNERQNALVSAAAAQLEQANKLLLDGFELDMLYADLEFAVEKLREFEGTDLPEDVVDGVFSRFCVGK